MEWGDDFNVVLYVASRLDSVDAVLSTTTGDIAHHLATSQQTVSRKLRQCEERGLLRRDVSPSGMKLALTEKSLSYLKQHHLLLDSFFSGKKESALAGVVLSGLGEGRYYMSLPGYQQQFQDVLGFVPFPGTLNLKVDQHALVLYLRDAQKQAITGFSTAERTYGGIDCFPIQATIRGTAVDAVLIIPHRTVHDKSVVELIAPFSFREKFSLRDGDEVRIK